MKYMLLKMLDFETLVQLNNTSVRAGRKRNLSNSLLYAKPQLRYPINHHVIRHTGKGTEVSVSVVLDLAGQTAFLDMSLEEFEAIPEVEVTFDVWEGVMCAGNPPDYP